MTSEREARLRGRPPRLTVAERREAVLDAAVEQFGGSRESTVSVEAIAAAAGMQKPSVYRLFASKEQLYSAAVAREIGRFTDELRATYAATTELRLGERIDARAAWLVASVRDRPARYRLLVRAFHTWPADDLPRGAELRASIIDALEELARTEARRDGVDLPDRAAWLIAESTFALTTMVVQLVLGATSDGATVGLAGFLADAMTGCVAAAVRAPG